LREKIKERKYMKSSLKTEKCNNCQHQIETDGWCNMFKERPAILPCGQHDMFELERMITGRMIRKNPFIIDMLIAGVQQTRK
jgi:hypothetical protein